MHLLVGIDTEGDNQWDAAARANQTFENIYALPRLHALFARHGVRPTYVITYPVAIDARSAEVLRGLLARGDCEIGAHHHAWETPPFGPGDVRRHAYALQLPRPQFEAQLASLTAAIEAAVGRKPVSYRSGRYGFSAEHVAGLERLGYTVESSVAPLFYEAHKGGPNFVEAPLAPYFLAYDDPVAAGSSNVLEVPVSAALNRRLPAWLQHAYARAPYNYQTKRALRALRLLRMRWLRPSYSPLEDMRSLARDLGRWQQPALNLLFHSSEAIVGGSPYNRTQAELDAFCDRLERFFEYAIGELDARPATFSEFRAAYCEEPQGVLPPEGGSHGRTGGGSRQRAGVLPPEGGSHEGGGGSHEGGGGSHERGGGSHERGGGSHERGGGSHERGGGSNEEAQGGSHERGDGSHEEARGGSHAAASPRTGGRAAGNHSR